MRPHYGPWGEAAPRHPEAWGGVTVSLGTVAFLGLLGLVGLGLVLYYRQPRQLHGAPARRLLEEGFV